MFVSVRLGSMSWKHSGKTVEKHETSLPARDVRRFPGGNRGFHDMRLLNRPQSCTESGNVVARGKAQGMYWGWTLVIHASTSCRNSSAF